MNNIRVEWLRRRPATLLLSFVLIAWFGFQLLILNIFDVETAKWIFYAELPPSRDPGLVLSPISHDMFDYTHIAGNIAFLLVVGGLIEPYVHRWKVPSMVIIGGYLVMVVTMFTAIFHQFWPLAGASGGIMFLWGYAGLRMWSELDLRNASPGGSIEGFASMVVLVAVPTIPLYEVFVNGKMGHAIGMVLGVSYFILERVTS